ncbi:hypothetical protein ACIGCZ_00875 [Streptomyces nigra]|uniref:hypothetical protein n=1 Tax=Streptomyces nigra TaxID=1827580 RepID=UPI0037CF05BA
MNPKLVNCAADVILAALTQNRTAAGIALALDSAQLLQSPGTTAETQRLVDRVAELEAKLAEYERPVDEDPIRYTLTDAAEAVVDGAPPQVQKLRGLLAVQRAAVEDPHDSPLHHDYLIGRDLPEVTR